MADTQKKSITEVKAYIKGLHISPRKVRLVAGVVSGMTVDDALANLTFMTKRAAKPIKKLVDSAVANASHNFQIAADRLFVKSLTVDGGQVLERFKPRAQGRAFPIRRRTSHVNLTLGVADKAFKTKRKAVVKKADKDETHEHKGEAMAENKKSRFGFKKKGADNSQLPAKQDPQGKYTSFDRRGGE